MVCVLLLAYCNCSASALTVEDEVSAATREKQEPRKFVLWRNHADGDHTERQEYDG
jgi:hypothetical protein